MTIDEIRSMMEEINPEALMANGFDDCLVGYLEQCGQPAALCYDAEKMVEKVAREMQLQNPELSPEDARSNAQEYLDFNTFGSYNGPGSPMWLNRF